jgi:hypothetical protein
VGKYVYKQEVPLKNTSFFFSFRFLLIRYFSPESNRLRDIKSSLALLSTVSFASRIGEGKGGKSGEVSRKVKLVCLSNGIDIKLLSFLVCS